MQQQIEFNITHNDRRAMCKNIAAISAESPNIIHSSDANPGGLERFLFMGCHFRSPQRSNLPKIRAAQCRWGTCRGGPSCHSTARAKLDRALRVPHVARQWLMDD